uniref:Transposon TX1 uncharacterized n=1 Tax=Cajanus cajan TaxID=3821 RepID=A0A151QX30_CAJCA|nr:Transposon TX1 uncharacterized [Cajanus cajan]
MDSELVDIPLEGLHISPKITAADNDSLLQPFCSSEFKRALFAMHSDKSRGPGGLNPGFYKRFWDLLGPKVFVADTHWLEQGEFPPQLNNTNVVLIPKTTNPTSMKDLCPISLCNVIYKILSKVLANRMKPLLNQCISLEQSAFVENRSILDNVLVAIELIHHMKCKKNGRTDLIGPADLSVYPRASRAGYGLKDLSPFISRTGFIRPVKNADFADRVLNGPDRSAYPPLLISNRHSRKGIHWLSWEKLSMRKEHGGMGFRNLYGFNLAMLGKQGWKFLTNQDAIVTRVFKAKYFPRGDFLGANLGHNPSFTWRSIHASQVVVRAGSLCKWCRFMTERCCAAGSLLRCR